MFASMTGDRMRSFGKMFDNMQNVNESARGSIKPSVAFNAYSAARKDARDAAAAQQPVRLVKRNKSGAESKIKDETTYYKSAEDAMTKVKYWAKINPGKDYSYNLYVDGKPVEVVR